MPEEQIDKIKLIDSDFIKISVSAITGALVSIYINKYYGNEILNNFQASNIITLIGISFAFIALFGGILITLFNATKFISYILEIVLRPILIFNSYLKNKIKIIMIIENILLFDPEPHLISFFKTKFFKEILFF